VLGVLQALPRIQDMSEEDGLFVESMMAALARDRARGGARLQDFVAKRGAKVAGRHERRPHPACRHHRHGRDRRELGHLLPRPRLDGTASDPAPGAERRCARPSPGNGRRWRR
jgi:hypothetical protein